MSSTVKKKHVTQSTKVAHWSVFSSFWTTVELKNNINDTLATGDICMQDQFNVGFSLFIGFIKTKKNIDHIQYYPGQKNGEKEQGQTH